MAVLNIQQKKKKDFENVLASTSCNAHRVWVRTISFGMKNIKSTCAMYNIVNFNAVKQLCRSVVLRAGDRKKGINGGIESCSNLRRKTTILLSFPSRDGSEELHKRWTVVCAL